MVRNNPNRYIFLSQISNLKHTINESVQTDSYQPIAEDRILTEDVDGYSVESEKVLHLPETDKNQFLEIVEEPIQLTPEFSNESSPSNIETFFGQLSKHSAITEINSTTLSIISTTSAYSIPTTTSTSTSLETSTTTPTKSSSISTKASTTSSITPITVTSTTEELDIIGFFGKLQNVTDTDDIHIQEGSSKTVIIGHDKSKSLGTGKIGNLAEKEEIITTIEDLVEETTLYTITNDSTVSTNKDVETVTDDVKDINLTTTEEPKTKRLPSRYRSNRTRTKPPEKLSPTSASPNVINHNMNLQTALIINTLSKVLPNVPQSRLKHQPRLETVGSGITFHQEEIFIFHTTLTELHVCLMYVKSVWIVTLYCFRQSLISHLEEVAFHQT